MSVPELVRSEPRALPGGGEHSTARLPPRSLQSKLRPREHFLRHFHFRSYQILSTCASGLHGSSSSLHFPSADRATSQAQDQPTALEPPFWGHKKQLFLLVLDSGPQMVVLGVDSTPGSEILHSQGAPAFSQEFGDWTQASMCKTNTAPPNLSSF